jgi:multidrug efflux pump subunit AcrA (membrane-fusion protein)
MWHIVIDPEADPQDGGQRFRRVAVGPPQIGGAEVAWPGGQGLLVPPCRGRPAGARGAEAMDPSHEVRAPMAARVLAVHVQGGATVDPGAVLMVLEAMKMEHPIVAPNRRTVAQVPVASGAQVTAGQLLLTYVQEAP